MDIDINILRNLELEYVRYGITSIDIIHIYKSKLIKYITESGNAIEETLTSYIKNKGTNHHVHEYFAKFKFVQIKYMDRVLKKYQIKLMRKFKLSESEIKKAPDHFEEKDIMKTISSQEVTKLKQNNEKLRMMYIKKKTYLQFLKSELEKQKDIEPIVKEVPEIISMSKIIIKNKKLLDAKRDRVTNLKNTIFGCVDVNTFPTENDVNSILIKNQLNVIP